MDITKEVLPNFGSFNFQFLSREDLMKVYIHENSVDITMFF